MSVFGKPNHYRNISHPWNWGDTWSTSSEFNLSSNAPGIPEKEWEERSQTNVICFFCILQYIYWIPWTHVKQFQYSEIFFFLVFFVESLWTTCALCQHLKKKKQFVHGEICSTNALRLCNPSRSCCCITAACRLLDHGVGEARKSRLLEWALPACQGPLASKPPIVDRLFASGSSSEWWRTWETKKFWTSWHSFLLLLTRMGLCRRSRHHHGRQWMETALFSRQTTCGIWNQLETLFSRWLVANLPHWSGWSKFRTFCNFLVYGKSYI